MPLTNNFIFFLPLVYTLSLLGIFYTSTVSLRTNHIKQITAYSSVGHMGVSTLGLFSYNTTSVVGGFYSLIQHSILSSGFFIMAGVVYDRYEVYELNLYNALGSTMPFFSLSQLFLLISNLPFPILGGFIGEFLILSGIGISNIVVFFIIIFNQLFCAAYTLWFIHKMLFSGLNINFSVRMKVLYYVDLNYRECVMFFFVQSFILVSGLFPSLFLPWLELSFLRVCTYRYPSKLPLGHAESTMF